MRAWSVTACLAQLLAQLLVLLLAAANVAAQPGCGRLSAGEIGGHGVVEVDGLVIRLRSGAQSLPVGEVLQLTVWVETLSGAPFAGELHFDARMPMHQHGMNLRPSVRRIAPGRYQLDGVLLHMPGCWSLEFEAVGDDGARTRAVIPAMVE